MFKKISMCTAISFFMVLFLFMKSGYTQESKSLAVSAGIDRQKPKDIYGIEVFSGYGLAKLKSKGDYKVAPVFVDFDFDIKPLIKDKFTLFPGLVQFVLEPFASYVYAPRNNAEIGNNFLIKIGILPESMKLQPYFKGGVGIIYLTQHTIEQGTQFNFNESVGVGAHYFFKKNIALTLEYRYRHISNADIKRPNLGIQTNLVLCGISYVF